MEYLGETNKKLYEKKYEVTKSTIERALAYYKLFLKCSATPHSDLKRFSQWQPLPMGHFKQNVDGTLFFDKHTAGIGDILRDNMGNVIWAATIGENQINQLDIVECLGSLQLCLHLGFPNLIIESNCQLVVNELSLEAPSSSDLGNLFLDIKALMANF